MSKPSKIVKLIESARPTKIWIDGRSHIVAKHRQVRESLGVKGYTEKFREEYEIEEVDDHFRTSFRLAAIYYQKLHRNFNDFSVEDFAERTGTKIIIPSGEVNEKIVIRGRNVENVIDARFQLHTIISLIREKNVVQQFVGIPVANDQVKKKFADFKETVLKEKSIKGMDESLFQKPERLHLTIGVFSLCDEIEIMEAVKALEECKTNIIDPFISKTGPLRIQLKGLDCMNANYKKANVMFANAKFCNEDDDGGNSLQRMVDSISIHFHERGLVRSFQDSVKLHVTLINTKYRKGKDGRKKWGRVPFDATAIIEKCKDFDFGECDFSEVHLSHVTLIDPNNGFYKPIATINV